MTMHRTTSLAAITIFLIQGAALTPICDKVCHCDDDLTIVDCKRIDSKIVPPVDMWPENATVLDLSSNFVKEVDVEMNHDQLITLKLNNNQIKVVNRSVFGGLKKLEFLDLSYNRIEDLELETFYGIENLVTLNISHNLIKKLPQNVFYNLVDLEELVLSANPFSYLEKAHFAGNINLNKLAIANIDAHALPYDLFATLTRFEFLDLAENAFHEVPTDAFRSAKALKWLDISNNPIEELHQKSFLRLTTLEVLKINFMPELKKVGPKTFFELGKLKILEMRVNKKLTFIDPDAFLGITGNSSNLEELDLELNSLSTLSEIECNYLKKLNLQNNPWMCDCHIRWMRECYFPEVLAADLKCSGPNELAGRLLRTIPQTKFLCEMHSPDVQAMIHHNRVLRAVSLSFVCIVLLMLAGLIIVVIKFRSIRTWYRNKKRGPGAVYYVRAKSFPAET